MDSELYKIQQQNFLTILTFYNKAREKADNYCLFIEKYKEYTKEYLKKIKQLLSFYSPSLYDEVVDDLFEEEIEDNKDQINNDEDYLVNRNSIKNIINLGNDKNKENDIINNKNDEKNQVIEEDYSPLNKLTNLLFKQLKTQIKGLNLLLKDIDLPIETLKNLINGTKLEIKILKEKYLDAKQHYLQEFDSYIKDNQELLTDFSNTENSLIQFYYLKNNEDIYVNNKNALKINDFENDINSNVIKLKTKENLFIEKDMENKIKNLSLKYNKESEEYIESVTRITLLIIENMRLNIENILDNFANSYNFDFNDLSNKIKNFHEMKTENEYEENIQKNVKRINENIILSSNEKYKPIKYEIQILKNKKINDRLYNLLINSGFNIQKENIEKFELKVEDIFLIVKKMYNFTMINKDNYDLEKESKKIFIIQIIDEIFEFKDKQKKIINDPKLSEEKLTQLYTYIESDKDLRYTFLEIFGKKRGEGFLEFEISLFNIITKIFLIILDSLLKKNEPDNARQLLILSQTYYKTENNDKIYLYQTLLNHQLFQKQEFWVEYVNNMIQKEFDKNQKIIKNKPLNNKNSEIVFAQVLAASECMKNYNLKEDDIINIINPIFENYKLDQIKREAILDNIK